jgi:hypothetical protein
MVNWFLALVNNEIIIGGSGGFINILMLMLLQPGTIIQIVQQIGSDVDGSIVITIPAMQTSASSAVAAVDAPHWNPFLFAILLLLMQTLALCILHNLSPTSRTPAQCVILRCVDHHHHSLVSLGKEAPLQSSGR